jgi:arylsulfatase A-like enzyme
MPTSRRRFLQSLSAVPFLQGEAKAPNFLFLLTDDQRFDTIRALGNSVIQTPNMDRLVARGVTFTDACTQGGLTGAICQPSRAQILTGRNVFQAHKAIVDRQDTPDPAVLTFPEHLRANGWQTFHTGKWHLGPKLFQRSFAAGADIFFGGMTDQQHVKLHDYSADGAYPEEKARTGEKFSSEIFADAAVNYLKNHDAKKPFLLSVAFTSPHDPRTAPARFAELYKPEKMVLPPNFVPRHIFDTGDMAVRDELLAASPRVPAEIRRHIADYYAMISEVDFQIGRIIDALDASGEADNTYIVFAGDNGLALGQHGLMGKQNLYECSLRVPLILAGPSIPKDKRNASLCNLMDIAPTITDLAGRPLHTWGDGRSLAGPARENRLVERSSTWAAYRNVQRSLRVGDYKLIVYQVGNDDSTQLFNLADDPDEVGPARRHVCADAKKATG